MDALHVGPRHGNVRELENYVQHPLISSRGPVLDVIEPTSAEAAARTAGSGTGQRLRDAEAAHMRRVLEQTGWTIEGPEGAANLLDIPASTLRSRLKKLCIVRPR